MKSKYSNICFHMNIFIRMSETRRLVLSFTHSRTYGTQPMTSCVAHPQRSRFIKKHKHASSHTSALIAADERANNSVACRPASRTATQQQLISSSPITMQPKSCTDLATLTTPAAIRRWLDSFDFVLTDCDGIIEFQAQLRGFKNSYRLVSSPHRRSHRRYYFFIHPAGVLWDQGKSIEGSAETLNALRALGKRVFFVTNNSASSRAQQHEKAVSLGHDVLEVSYIFTPSL